MHVPVVAEGSGGAGAAVRGCEPAGQREDGHAGPEAVVVTDGEGDVGVCCAHIDRDVVGRSAGYQRL